MSNWIPPTPDAIPREKSRTIGFVIPLAMVCGISSSLNFPFPISLNYTVLVSSTVILEKFYCLYNHIHYVINKTFTPTYLSPNIRKQGIPYNEMVILTPYIESYHHECGI
jgi:hypothetical protein